LLGLKENVIIGKLIPAGTGFPLSLDEFRLEPGTEPEPQALLEDVEEEPSEEDDLSKTLDFLELLGQDLAPGPVELGAETQTSEESDDASE
jgi:hypothetical protein